MNVNLKSLIGKLNATCLKTLDAAGQLCRSRTNYEVDIEHWLLKLNELPNTDFERLLRHYDIDQMRISKDLNRNVDRLKTGNVRIPAFSPYVIRLIRDAWLFASVDCNDTRIRSSHLLFTLLADEEVAPLSRSISAEWEKIKVEDLRKNVLILVKGSEEDKDELVTSKGKALEAQVKPKIFLSYRREDSAGWARSLCMQLGQHFGKNSVFLDIDAISLGRDFAEAIQNSVASCDVLIALIGRQWLDSVDNMGHRRLDNPEDVVRLEIIAALEKDIPVIPTLLLDAVMPRSIDLPDALKPLARRNAHRIDESHFDYDITRLIEVLERDLKSPKTNVASEHSDTSGQPTQQQAVRSDSDLLPSAAPEHHSGSPATADTKTSRNG